MCSVDVGILEYFFFLEISPGSRLEAFLEMYTWIQQLDEGIYRETVGTSGAFLGKLLEGPYKKSWKAQLHDFQMKILKDSLKKFLEDFQKKYLEEFQK